MPPTGSSPGPVSAAGARRTLFEEQTPARSLRGWVSFDEMTAGLACQLPHPWPDCSADELAALLERGGVRRGLDAGALEELAGLLRAGRAPAERVVARGEPAENGRDGALEFIIRPSNEGARYRRDPASDRVDFRETNLVENVLTGEPVAIEIPPRPGRDGITVLGRRVPSAAGRPARFTVGQGARLDAASRQILAVRDGRVLWENLTVSVSDLYRVRGSVDYSVGNIAFVGEVIIDGDVLDGFSVRAGRRLTVGGNLGACKADSEGDLLVGGGVFGRGRARLRAKGTLRARFLNECRAESSGSMTVEREAVGALLLTNRRLLMPSGSLVGGEASALGGAEVATIGSPLGVPTRLAVGTDYNVAHRQAEVESRVVEVDAAADKISGFLGPLLGDRRRLAALITRRRSDIDRLVRALRELRAERAELAAELDRLADCSQRGAVRQINVRSVVHPGALLEIGAVRHRLKQAIVGPVSIYEDRAQASLRTAEFRELPAGGENAVPSGNRDDSEGDQQ